MEIFLDMAEDFILKVFEHIFLAGRAKQGNGCNITVSHGFFPGHGVGSEHYPHHPAAGDILNFPGIGNGNAAIEDVIEKFFYFIAVQGKIFGVEIGDGVSISDGFGLQLKRLSAGENKMKTGR